MGFHNKEMLEQYREEVLEGWLLDKSTQDLRLPSVPSLPWVEASSKEDTFKKTCVWGHPGSDHHVSFVENNSDPYGFVWHTTSEKLAEAVRWGIIPVESITGKVIGALGHYRVVEHERILKGVISDRHREKLALLDHYQNRFTALQDIESLVNQLDLESTDSAVLEVQYNALKTEYNKVFQHYIITLRAMQAKPAQKKFSDGIDADVKRAEDYLAELNEAFDKHDLEKINRFNAARGNDSVLEFVKTQMMESLYEMQAVNQNLSFQKGALTRGVMNDVIEDARKLIDDHRANPRDMVLPKHHGRFPENCNAHNFKKDHLSPEREKEVLGAISFIEQWDKVIYEGDQPELHVTRHSEGSIKRKRSLTVTSATNWRSSQNLKTFFKKIGITFLNTLKSFLFKTQTWDENPWDETDAEGNYVFRPFACELRKSSYVGCYEPTDPWYVKLRKLILTDKVPYHGARPNLPLWHKPVRFFRSLFVVSKNVVMGFADFIKSLVHLFKVDIKADYDSAKEVPMMESTQTKVEKQIAELETEFKCHMMRINSLLTEKNGQTNYQEYYSPTSNEQLEKLNLHSSGSFASMPFHLVQRDQNDIISSVVRGVDSFASFFTHGFAKDPVGAVGFAIPYVCVAGSIILPTAFAFLGPTFQGVSNTVGSAVASGGVSSAVAAGGLAGQVGWGAVEFIEHGPQSGLVKTIKLVLDNPLTLGAGIGVAFLAGSVITLLPAARHDLGSVQAIGKLTFGGKSAVALLEIFEKAHQNPGKPIKFEIDGRELELRVKLTDAQAEQNKKFQFVSWLVKHKNRLPMLDDNLKFELERQIDDLFKKDKHQADALKEFIYPFKENMIAHQLVTIPLSYIPALFRGLASFISSAITSSPEPMKRAWGALGKKIIKDLSRLVVIGEGIVHLVGFLVATIFKIPTQLIGMAICRVAAMFDVDASAGMYKLMNYFHIKFRQFGEILYSGETKYIRSPFAWLSKEMSTEHPCSAAYRQEATQKRMMEKLNASAVAPAAADVMPAKAAIQRDRENLGNPFSFFNQFPQERPAQLAKPAASRKR